MTEDEKAQLDALCRDLERLSRELHPMIVAKALRTIATVPLPDRALDRRWSGRPRMRYSR
jgi:hypothetical protein